MPEIAIPDPTNLPEPSLAAEAGVTTSEWKFALGYVVQLAAAGTAAVATHAGLHLDTATIALAVALEFLAGSTVIGYVISRGVRKAGTPAK